MLDCWREYPDRDKSRIEEMLAKSDFDWTDPNQFSDFSQWFEGQVKEKLKKLQAQA